MLIILDCLRRDQDSICSNIPALLLVPYIVRLTMKFTASGMSWDYMYMARAIL